MKNDFIGFLAAKLGLANSTLSNMSYRFQKFEEWLRVNHLELNAASCELYINEKKAKGQAPSTLNLYIDMFANLDKYFKDRNISLVVSTGFKRTKPERKHIDLLTIPEIEKLTNTHLKFGKDNQIWKDSDRTYLLLTTFLAYTGCRFSEARDLQIKNIDVETGRVLIARSKGKSFRYVYLPPPIIKRIKPLLNGEADTLVFRTLRKDKIYDSNYLANLRKRAKQCGINKRVYPHLFRHSMATQLIVDGVPIEQVAIILGHKDITTTFETYVHLADSTVRKAMYRHALFKQSTSPSDIIQAVLESFKGFKLETDERFKYEINEGTNSLDLQLFLK